MWDCIVVGGGPAGSTFAGIVLTHRPETKIAVIEKERFPRFHIGESLVSEINTILHEMGVYNTIHDAGFVKKHGAVFRWGNNKEIWRMNFGDMGPFKTLAKFGQVQTSYTWHVDRAHYDQYLLNHVSSLGAEIFPGYSVVDILEEQGRAVGVRLSDGRILRARYVIDASGQAGLGPRGRDKDMDPKLKNVAYWGYWRNFNFLPDYTGTLDHSMAFIVAHPHGWSWCFPIRPDLMSVGVVTDFEKHRGRLEKDAEVFYKTALQSCPEMQEILKGAELISYGSEAQKVHSMRDFSYISRSVTMPGLMRVGDAAGFVDPVLSVGCFLGQFFARILAYGTLSLLRGDEGLSEEMVCTSYEEHLRDALSAYREITYFFYRFNGSPGDWWAKARTLVEDSQFSLAATNENAFNVFLTGLAARRSLFRVPTAFFEDVYFREGARKWIKPKGFFKKTLKFSDSTVPCFKFPVELHMRAIPVDGQGRMAPAISARLLRNDGESISWRDRIYTPLWMKPLFQLIDGRRSVKEIVRVAVDHGQTLALLDEHPVRQVVSILADLWERDFVRTVESQ